MRAVKKPNLSLGSSFWVNPDYLPDILCDELKLHIRPAGLPDASVRAFLASCGTVAQYVKASRSQISLAAEKNQIDAIATHARSLLASINRLDRQAIDTLGKHGDALQFVSSPAVRLPPRVVADAKPPTHENGLLSRAWDYVLALEQVANYASVKLKPSTSTKPETTNARHLTSQVVDHFRHHFGALPPADAASWFAGFMACLGGHLGLRCGAGIVRSVITGKRTPVC